ncbi:MAG TPA: hypothetical protein VML19_12740 [Verrucomicrobiae bacterium]|nr:hypothetical protein [Verrucomicrobiae bacterium]
MSIMPIRAYARILFLMVLAMPGAQGDLGSSTAWLAEIVKGAVAHGVVGGGVVGVHGGTTNDQRVGARNNLQAGAGRLGDDAGIEDDILHGLQGYGGADFADCAIRLSNRRRPGRLKNRPQVETC